MKKHLTISTIVALLAVTGAAILSQASVHARQDNRALALLDRARAALGGEAKLKSVQSLSATAKFRRILAKDQPELSGELQLDILLPDKYMTTEESTLPMGGAQLTRINGLNGDQPFRDARTSGGGGGMMIVRVAPDNPGPQAEAGVLRAARAEFARYLIAWLLTAPAGQALEFSYVGEAQADEGRAEVIDVKGTEGFALRLFLDKESHRPLMLTYRGTQPRVMMRTLNTPAASREEAEKHAKEAGEKASKEIASDPPEARMVGLGLTRELLDQPPGDRWREQRLALGDHPNGGDELLGRRVLEEVAAGAGAHRRVHVLVEVERREHEHLGVGQSRRRRSAASPRCRRAPACGCPSARRRVGCAGRARRRAGRSRRRRRRRCRAGHRGSC